VQPIRRAVFAQDRLWLLHAGGSLVSLDPGGAAPEAVASPGTVVEICASGDGLTALADDGRGSWILQQSSPGGWVGGDKVPSDGDTLVAVDCAAGGDITLVTNRRLLRIGGGTVQAIRLKQELQPPLTGGTALATADALWVGLDSGEWGGGLRRIGRTDGHVATVESNRSGALCGGPLNTACDPVTGVAASPWNPSCVVATWASST
jgi:hypothetical protein